MYLWPQKGNAFERSLPIWDYREYPLGGDARTIYGWAVDTTARPFFRKILKNFELVRPKYEIGKPQVAFNYLSRYYVTRPNETTAASWGRE